MSTTRLQPHRISRPVQLSAALLTFGVLIAGALIAGAVRIDEPSWVSPMLCIITAVVVLAVIALVFLMLTRFRPQLQDDSYYLEWLKWQNVEFRHFRAENLGDGPSEVMPVLPATESWEEREERRLRVYELDEGVFLVHTWRPSRTPGQVADIAISLQQHGDGPLSRGTVDTVEYHLGPKFFDHPVVKANASENFRIDVSAYGPMLCLARVNFNDGRPPLDLQRYINF